MALFARIAVVAAALSWLGAAPAFAQMSGAQLLQIDPTKPDPMAAMDMEVKKNPTIAMPQVDLGSDEPVTLEADEIGYDQNNALVVARGHVEVMQGSTIMNADQLTYFQRLDVVKATGNVSMLQSTGDVYFADYVELKDHMKRGVIHHFQARMSDNSVFAANEGYKVNANLTRLHKAAYTPCNLCVGEAPFWQMNARDIEIDNVDEKVRYANAHMEMMGVPVFYTPYFSHPTPDAEAKSGLLNPEYSSGANLGTTVKVPYYWRIAPDKDITLVPWYSGDEGPLLEGNYHQLTDKGEYRARFSGTYPDKLDSNGNRISGNEFRGHIYADGKQELDEYSRVGFNIARASDDTYLRRYRFGDERVLFSRLYAETAKNRNYALAQGMAIQGLRITDDPDTTPLVLPTLEGYYETDPYASGLTLHAFANAQSLTRDVGVDQNRLSVTAGASLPYITEGGHVLTLTANLRNDLYDLTDVPVTAGTFNGTKSRIIPQAALEWRYPLIRGVGADALTIEPIVLVVAQPNGGNPEELLNANEDNRLIELTDTNLFSLDRMPGLDTVDSGSRLAYGLRSQYLFAAGQTIDMMLGQNYNTDDQTPFPNSTTPGENLSDLIGRVALDYAPVVLGYRFALDRKSLTSNRTELSVSFYEPWLSVDTVYRAIQNNRYLRDSEEAIANASFPLTDEWTIYGGARRDLEFDQMIATNVGLIYRNECFTMVLQSLRTYTRDRDIEPSTAFMIRLGFKNLGEFGDF